MTHGLAIHRESALWNILVVLEVSGIMKYNLELNPTYSKSILPSETGQYFVILCIYQVAEFETNNLCLQKLFLLALLCLLSD